MLTLTKSQLSVVLKHCTEEYPQEACGLLLGRGGKVEEVFTMNNIKKSSTQYLIDPRQQFRIFEKMRREKKELVGIYHSHSATSAYPSVKDKEMAFYPKASYLIVSLRDFSNPEVRSFKIREGGIDEEKIKIVKGANLTN